MSIIEVENVTKVYTSYKKEKGIWGAVKGLIAPEKKIIEAVKSTSFSIEQGQIVGYIGPNGAGKSTMIKILTGILHPTSGQVHINGISPQSNRKAVVKSLGVVFGQRSQLYWDLQLGESFELLRRIYQVDRVEFHKNLSEVTEVLGLSEFIDKPVRQLSLGQRMRGDLAAAMLHSPSILFLDEPTIGLDTEAKYKIRQFIREMNQSRKVTIILTTHDLDDVQELCDRVIIVNDGRIIEDGPLESIIYKLNPKWIVRVDLKHPCSDVSHPIAEVIKHHELNIWYQFEKDQISIAQLISDLSRKIPIQDLSVKEPDIEDAIREVYQSSYVS